MNNTGEKTEKKFNISVIPGDGVGPEVTAEAVRVLEAVSEADKRLKFEFTYYPWGCEYYLKHGKMMDEDGLERMAGCDAILLGAVGDPRVPDHISLWDLLLRIRKGFDQYINLRPVKLLKGATCPIKGVSEKDVDMIFVRENSEGEYSGRGRRLREGTAEEEVIQEDVFTRKGCERVMRYAYNLARGEGKTLSSITKSNAINYSMVFWDSVFKSIGEEYPDVETRSYLVDAASMFMVRDPGRFQVVVTSNLFGDILTDLGAAIAGGMGLAAGANLNPEKKYPSMFEPIHGSAPDIAGQNKANPLASIWTVSQMLEFFGENQWAARIIDVIEEILTEKKFLTADIGGSSGTSQVGGEAARKIKETVLGGPEDAVY